MSVEIKLLKKLFEQGALAKVEIMPAPMQQDCFVMVFFTINGDQEQITRARDKTTKIYKRINGAVTDAKNIGFKEVILRFD